MSGETIDSGNVQVSCNSFSLSTSLSTFLFRKPLKHLQCDRQIQCQSVTSVKGCNSRAGTDILNFFDVEASQMMVHDHLPPCELAPN